MIVLASASPRRRTLLEHAGVEFRLDPADIDETVDASLPPAEVAEHLARRKALAVAVRHPSAALVIGADTTVVVPPSGAGRALGPWDLLGKPGSAEDARAMLRRLSDTRHRVVTGVCIARGVLDSGGEPVCVSGSETTWVTMRAIAPAEVDAYVASGEWRGKAGGYAIQENADAFVTRLEEGGFDNVVGLPVALTLELLDRARKAHDDGGPVGESRGA